MKGLINLIAILSACLLQACSTTPDTQPQPEQDIVKASLDQPDSIKPQTFILRGEVVAGSEVRSFKPCGSNQQLWLEMPATLTDQAIKLSQSPYQPMYGELVGYLMPPSQTGYNGDYSARFMVQSINILSTENPKRCLLPATSTSALGTEPGWSMKFSQNQFLFLSQNDKAQTLKVKDEQIEGDKRTYTFNNGELTLNRDICSDGMSDSLYGWRSELSLNGHSYTGCATLGNSDPTQLWAGQYSATSTKNSGFSVDLLLSPDHMAITQYTYDNGEPAIIEKGYWQQLNSQQIQVVMTSHQQQYLVSERIFTREDNKLVAQKEKVGNVVYPMANGGLVLYSSAAYPE